MLPSRHAMAKWCLRLGLAATFGWIGYDVFMHPDAWIGFLPAALPFNLDRTLALQLSGGFDLALGALLLLGFFPRLTSLLASVHLAAIIFYHGIDAVVIRDVGLLGASLALFFWPQTPRPYHRHSWWYQRLPLVGRFL